MNSKINYTKHSYTIYSMMLQISKLSNLGIFSKSTFFFTIFSISIISYELIISSTFKRVQSPFSVFL